MALQATAQIMPRSSRGRRTRGCGAMSIKSIVVVVASLATVTKIDAHGGLMIPPCRNNHGNVNVFNFTTQPGEKWLSGGSCAGDMCLWFNDGCFIGCPNCTSTVSTLPGTSGEVPDRFIKPNCRKPHLMEPTLPDEFRTWNIGNPSVYGDWTKYHPWRAPGYAPVSDPWCVLRRPMRLLHAHAARLRARLSPAHAAAPLRLAAAVRKPGLCCDLWWHALRSVLARARAQRKSGRQS